MLAVTIYLFIPVVINMKNPLSLDITSISCAIAGPAYALQGYWQFTGDIKSDDAPGWFVFESQVSALGGLFFVQMNS